MLASWMVIGLTAPALAGLEPVEPQDPEHDTYEPFEIRELPVEMGPEPTGIVNGEVAHNGEYPQVVALMGYNHPYAVNFCSGTLIAEEWILTAAHCIDDFDAQFPGSGWGLYVAFGGPNIYDDWTHFVEAEQFISHPGYNSHNLSNDIGLIELTEPVQDIPPMVLNTETIDNGWAGTDIRVVGFGITGDGKQDSGVKRFATVELQYFDSQFFQTYDSQSNICSGDSGGAGLRMASDGYEITGVNSYGFNPSGGGSTCEGGWGGLARVDQYIDWITDHATNAALEHGGSGGGEGPDDPDQVADGDALGPWDTPQRPEEDAYKGCQTAPLGSGLVALLAGGLVLLGGVRRAGITY